MCVFLSNTAIPCYGYNYKTKERLFLLLEKWRFPGYCMKKSEVIWIFRELSLKKWRYVRLFCGKMFKKLEL